MTPLVLLTLLFAALALALGVGWWRDRARRAADAQSAPLLAFFEDLPALFQAFDADQRLVAFNRECERVLGYRADELLHNPNVFERFYPDPLYRQQILAEWEARGGEVSDWELDSVTRDGEVRTISWSSRSGRYPVTGWDCWSVGIDVTSRKRMESALRRLRAAVDYAPEVMITLSSDGWIIDVNDPACERLEYTREELLRMHLSDINPLYPMDQWPKQWQILKKRRQVVAESVHRTRSGREVPVELSVGYYEHEGKEYCCAFARDIVARKQVESEKQVISVLSRLFLAARGLETIYEQVPEILCQHFGFGVATIELYDAAAGEMVIVGAHGLATPGAQPLRAQPLRVPAYQSISGTVAKSGRAIVESDARKRDDYRFFLLRKLELRAFVGVPLEGGGKAFGAVTLADRELRDLQPALGDSVRVVADHLAKEIERQQAQEALRLSQDRWQSLLENMPDSVSLLDLDGRVLFSNRPLVSPLPPLEPAGEPNGDDQFVDEAGGEVEPPHLLDQVPRQQRDEVRRAIASVAATGETFHYEIPLTAGNGEVRWFSCRLGPVRRGPEITALILVAQDVSHLRRVQEEGRRLEDQLRQAQKMESIGQLAGGVAHDFNNLLVAIQGHAEFALEDLPADAPAKSDLEGVLEAAERATTLTRQLLAFSRRQVLQPTELALNEVITDLLKILYRVIGEHIKLQLVPGPDLGTVRADRGQIEQVIMNLCVNSRDALPQGGRITLETRNVELGPAFCARHPWARQGRFALLAVADDGCGMDAATLEQIFEPFFTTKEAGTGTGLGLSTVYGIVKQHEGLIHVTSEPGRGTTFEIYLPLVETPAAAVDEPRAEAVRGGAETILLAEDEEMVRDLVVRFLELAGYRVLTATNGAEAVTLFASHAEEVDLVLLDMIMPVMGGAEARDRIRELRPDTRFLYSSGYRGDLPHFRANPDDDVPLVTKPYRREVLLRKIREILDR